jgi:hypothetical protein
MATIININGTSDNSCSCDSWLDHWNRFSGQNARICSVIDCYRTDIVGAHVQKYNSTNRNWYIVPLCREHNQSTNDLEISENVAFASANTSRTCRYGL